MTELLSCPFCGSTNVRTSEVCDERFAAICRSCRASGPERDDHDPAITAWNTRAGDGAEMRARATAFRDAAALMQSWADKQAAFSAEEIRTASLTFSNEAELIERARQALHD